LDLDAVWDVGSAGSKDEAVSWDWQLSCSEGNFEVDVGHPIVNNGDFVA